MNRIQVIQGGQYGSEAKGAIAAHLCVTEGIDFAVRTGATNAGHTVEYNGKRYVCQQLPVGWVRPETTLALGPGALIDPAILDRECAMVSEATGANVRERLYIDHRAYIHRAEHAERSHESGRHAKIGATGKGCSEALIDRVRLRGIANWTVGGNEKFRDYNITDVEAMLNYAYDDGAKIQLEGTQGQLLDLCLGPYPYTTHKQTGPAQWMVEAGLSPALPTDIIMVVRTFPIRVAGNSGPLPNEMSWPYLAREINAYRRTAGQSEIVEESAIVMFEHAVRAAAERFNLPPHSTGLDQHMWHPSDRVKYQVALSELNAYALRALDDATRDELRKLFEITTVTKKLRRVARLDTHVLAKSARQVRPHRVAVTFLNYVFPQRWCTSDPITDENEIRYLRMIEEACEAPVVLVNRGPSAAHVVCVDKLHERTVSA